MTVEAIIFDKDGTLFDFQRSWGDAMVELLESAVAPNRLEGAALALGFDLERAQFMPGSVVIAGTSIELARVLAPYMQRDEQEALHQIDVAAERARMVPAVDLVSCLGRLGRDHVLGLVTNDSEAPSRRHLEAAGIADCFAFLAGCDSGHGSKPAPDPLLAFAKATSIAPERTLMVGDSRTDLVAAKAAGMRPIAVLTGVAGAEELARDAEAVLSDIGQLADWIADQFPGGTKSDKSCRNRSFNLQRFDQDSR
ncbi:MAG: HAD family hydrolase [Boseongicola sp. SB0677_bin_26]|nr:HAD family hydrolase [Boseongicola sp. SB0665_bin_10]MYG26381.1 HAD family hydrolase [Boseongicola sp. SB0677_bin_26]